MVTGAPCVVGFENVVVSFRVPELSQLGAEGRDASGMSRVIVKWVAEFTQSLGEHAQLRGEVVSRVLAACTPPGFVEGSENLRPFQTVEELTKTRVDQRLESFFESVESPADVVPRLHWVTHRASSAYFGARVSICCMTLTMASGCSSGG